MAEVEISTVASSVFSLLNINRSMPVARVREAMELQGFECSQRDVDAAIKALENRALIVVSVYCGTAVIESRYPANWVMTIRDRRDPTGWSGWVMKNLETQEHRRLEELQPVAR